MELIEHHIEYATPSSWVEHVPIGDIHGGTRQCDEALLDAVIADIKARSLPWFGLGDWADLINAHDRRFDIANLAPWLLHEIASFGDTRKDRDEANYTIASLQVDWLEKKITPIKHLGLGIGIGNHDETLRKQFENNVGHTLALRLGLPYLGFSSWNKLLYHRNGHTETFNLYIHHGYYAGRAAAGRKGYLRRLLQDNPEADIIIVAHAHVRDLDEVEDEIPRWTHPPTVQKRRRLAILTGAFKQTKSQPGQPPTWEETKGFKGGPLGPVRFLVQPEQRQLMALF